MHFPVNIHIAGAVIPVHFVCETLAYTIGFRYYVYLRSRQHDLISDHHRMIIFVGAAIGGFIGSHILGVLERPDQFGEMSLAYFMGNTTIVGGLLGGLAGVEITKKIIGVSASSGDLMVYPIILAMLVGRLGCFLAGLPDGTYGIASNLPWAINFGDGVRRHPTNLYEMLFWILLWITISQAERRINLADGSRFKLMMVAYLVFRFASEFIKPDYFFSFGLSSIQLACLAGLVYYYRFILRFVKTPNNHA